MKAKREENSVWFWCPGCDSSHRIVVSPVPNAWGFNDDYERPTITPSILVKWPANPDAADEFKEWRTERICHSFVTDGEIDFLSDSTHALAGQKVPLPDWPE